jgi:hypothetical protein
MNVFSLLLIFALASTGASADVSSSKMDVTQKSVVLDSHEITLANGAKVNLDASTVTTNVDPKTIATERTKLAQDSGKFTRRDHRATPGFCKAAYNWLVRNPLSDNWNNVEGLWAGNC